MFAHFDLGIAPVEDRQEGCQEVFPRSRAGSQGELTSNGNYLACSFLSGLSMEMTMRCERSLPMTLGITSGGSPMAELDRRLS